MTRRRRLLVPAVSTAIMLAILCGLGIWQLRRLDWKTALLARIDAAEASPGVPLPAEPAAFQKVRVTGSLRPGVIGRYGVDVRDTPQGQALGSQVVGLLDRSGKPSIVTLLGWAPTGKAVPVPAGTRQFEGYIRLPTHPGLFSAADDPAKRLFYTLDPATIGQALGAARVAPFALVVMGQPLPGIFPAPATEMPRPPNNHLQYALTWFGLAVTLLVIFAIHARRVLSA